MRLRAFLIASLFALPAQAANLAPQTLALAGVAPTYNTAASGGDAFSNDGKTYAHIKNGSGSSMTVTFDSVATYSDNALGDLTLADIVVTVPAGGERIVGNFPPARFNDVNGRVNMAYSSATSVTVAVVKEGRGFQ